MKIESNKIYAVMYHYIHNNGINGYKFNRLKINEFKSQIRFFKKNYTNGNSYGVDTNAIFIGGISSGGITAIHTAYIDNISDLPTSPIDVQSIANALGGIDGDAGNFGYSSSVNGIISFAGGINDLNWIDANDEPIVSCQGDQDETVNYNCGPGQNNSLVLTLCGVGEMQPQANLVGINNDALIFNNEGHLWPVSGNSNPKFIQANNFTSDFLFPLLPCNTITSTNNIKKDKEGKKRILDGVPKTYNALLRSLRIQEKVASVGFEWNNSIDIIEKMR